jgi:hypothetical protein
VPHPREDPPTSSRRTQQETLIHRSREHPALEVSTTYSGSTSGSCAYPRTELAATIAVVMPPRPKLTVVDLAVILVAVFVVTALIFTVVDSGWVAYVVGALASMMVAAAIRLNHRGDASLHH